MTMDFNDTQTAAWLRSQQTQLEAVALNSEFPEIQYKQLVPVVTGGNEFAGAVSFYSGTAVGQAEFINGNADDIPLADIDSNARVQPVYMAAIGYAYGSDEV